MTEVLAGLLGVVLLVTVVYSGLEGIEAPDRNFSLTFVFVTFWLGLVLLSVLFGDVFRAFNPWRAIARTFSGVFRLVARQSPPPALDYPERLGHWPAVAGILAFVWLELVYGASGLSIGLRPEIVAVATLVYTAITFVAMALFGVERWIEKGEAFSVYFRMFSTLSPLEVRDGRLGLRRPLAGATSWGERARLARAGAGHDRGDQLRRRHRGRAGDPDHRDASTCSATSAWAWSRPSASTARCGWRS